MIEKSKENLKNEELINFSLDKINSFLDQKDQNKKLFEYLKDLHNADIADIIQNLDEVKRLEFVNIIRDVFDPEILTYLN